MIVMGGIERRDNPITQPVPASVFVTEADVDTETLAEVRATLRAAEQ